MHELADLSRSRGGAAVRWIVIHTAEGPTDAYPTDAGRDAGSADSLTAFALRMGDRSWHACADDDVLRDELVPYDRAAWTLRNGSEESENLEMCGLASWTRAEWLQHRGMLAHAARWVARRCRARGITPRRLSDAQVAGRQAAGYLDHGAYTRATKDGTHWDVGPGFPWDVFGSMVAAAYAGDPIAEEDSMALSDSELAEVLKAARQVNATIGAGQASAEGTWEATLAGVQRVVNDLAKAVYLLSYGDHADDAQDPGTHPNNLQRVRRELAEDRAAAAAQFAAVLEALKGVLGGSVDLAAVEAAAERGAAEALGRVQLVVEPEPAPAAG